MNIPESIYLPRFDENTAQPSIVEHRVIKAIWEPPGPAIYTLEDGTTIYETDGLLTEEEARCRAVTRLRAALADLKPPEVAPPSGNTPQPPVSLKALLDALGYAWSYTAKDDVFAVFNDENDMLMDVYLESGRAWDLDIYDPALKHPLENSDEEYSEDALYEAIAQMLAPWLHDRFTEVTGSKREQGAYVRWPIVENDVFSHVGNNFNEATRNGATPWFARPTANIYAPVFFATEVEALAYVLKSRK